MNSLVQRAGRESGKLESMLPMVALLLVLLSCLMVFSSTGTTAQEKLGDSYFYLRKQITAAAVGLVAMTLCSYIPVRAIKKISPFCFPLCILLLVGLFIPGLGKVAGGAQRWLQFGFFRFQPGEIVKLSFIIFMAGFFARHVDQLTRFSVGILRPAILLGAVGGLFLVQPDFGSFMVVSIVSLLMGAVVGIRMRHLLFCGVAGAGLVAVLVIFSPYRMARVVAFLDPFADPSGKGYQLIQSLIAVGTGRFTGVGIGASQQKLFFLPAAHTDFIFAVIAEEMGFVGCVAVLMIFLSFLWLGLSVAKKAAHDTFALALAVGLTLLIVMPALLNMGVVTGLLPTKGMVLPLVGFGGSSLIVSLSGVGLLRGIARSVSEGKL